MRSRPARVFALASFWVLIGFMLQGCLSSYAGALPNLGATSPAEVKHQLEFFRMDKPLGISTTMGDVHYAPESLPFVFERVSPEARKQLERGLKWDGAAGVLFSAGSGLAGFEALAERNGLKNSRGKVGLALVLTGFAAAGVGHFYQVEAAKTFNAALRAKLVPVIKSEAGRAQSLKPGVSLGLDGTL